MHRRNDALLCSSLLALCASKVVASNFLTTASDRVFANDICYSPVKLGYTTRTYHADATGCTQRTMGFVYSGNPRTSFAAFFAISADSNETNACPRMRKLLCATTSSTSPYDLNRPRKDAFSTGILIFSFRFWMYNVSVATSSGGAATAPGACASPAAMPGTGAGAAMLVTTPCMASCASGCAEISDMMRRVSESESKSK